jgi:hypothetical protein
MLKPDFGRVDRRIEWTEDRIAWVRHLAEVKNMTAREIAVDVGLSADQAPRIFEICKRCDIALSGQGGRPKPAGAAAIYSVAVAAHHVDLLSRLAKRHALYPGKVAELLLNAALETGGPFCENLLDLEAGA